MGKDGAQGGYGFGAFKGVFTPSILTIIGVVMYLRFGWVLGNLGLARTLLLVTVCNSVTFLTGLSLSALATNRTVRGGGAYYLVSRAFGAEAGAAVGIPLFVSQAVSVAFYVAGFTEALQDAFPSLAGIDPRVLGTATLAALGLLATFSANAALKAQFFIMGAIALSLASFFLGGAPEGLPDAAAVQAPAGKGFFFVLAVFFPAVTGILSGLGMSGDLADPGKAIPAGTLGAIATGYAIYLAVPVALHAFVGNHPALVSDPGLFRACARWPGLVLLGVWAACLSSALGSLLAAPRVLQALSRDRLVPPALGRGYGRGDDPRAAAALAFALALAATWAGGVDVLAPVLTMVNLLVYALLNLAAALEETVRSPAWRPSFRVPATVSAAGFALCCAVMLLVSPGATVAAVLVVGAIDWLMVRRRIRARWNDLRRSLLRGTVRATLRRLVHRPEDERNWQPDVLALGAATARRPWLADLAGALSRDRGLLTLASVVPDAGWTAERRAEARETVRDWAAKRGIDAFVRVHPAPDAWTGMRELVRTYGFGPLAPNTVLLGAPSDAESADGAGSVAALAARLRLNVALAAPGRYGEEGAGTGGPRRIDVWWRGRGGNAPFLLALACLLRQSRAWEGAELRLCHVAEPGEDPVRAEESLRTFLAEARVRAGVSIVSPTGGRGAREAIAEASAGTGIALFGLRPPAPDEPDAAYGAYLFSCRNAAGGVPLAIFALAAEGLDFGSMFE